MTKKVLVEVTDRGAVYVNGGRITGRHTKWGVHRTIFTSTVKIPVNKVRQLLSDNGYGHIRLDPEYAAEFGI